MSQQQSQTVQVIQKNGGCLSGCGTVFAVILVIGIAVAYWYVALPLAVILVGGWLWYRNQQKKKLPPPKAGPADAWLNRIAIKLSDQGFAEQTRNTGQHLGGSPLKGDLVMDGHGMRLFVNAMNDDDSATQTANRLRAQDDFQNAIARKLTEVQTQGQFVFIARSNVGVIDSSVVSTAMESVAPIVTDGAGQKTLDAAKTGHSEPAAAEPVGGPKQDVLGDLQRLAALRDSGVITAEEFEAKKAELLKRL